MRLKVASVPTSSTCSSPIRHGQPLGCTNLGTLSMHSTAPVNHSKPAILRPPFIALVSRENRLHGLGDARLHRIALHGMHGGRGSQGQLAQRRRHSPLHGSSLRASTALRLANTSTGKITMCKCADVLEFLSADCITRWILRPPILQCLQSVAPCKNQALGDKQRELRWVLRRAAKSGVLERQELYEAVHLT